MYRQVQHIRNVFGFVPYFQDRIFKASALAVLAGQFHIGQELHFHGHGTIALASLTSSCLEIE
jgi:hypothetical protein